MEYLILIIINIFSFISTWVVFFIFRNYLPNYFSKKGENLATKEDVAEITKQIEQVKLEFTDKSQILLKKRETYEKITHGMQIFIEGHSAGDTERKSTLEAYSIAWLWASDKVIKKFNHHIDLQIKRTLNKELVSQEELKQSYSDCILEMRKDSGNSDTELEEQDFRFIKF
jgi:hypothetical protein